MNNVIVEIEDGMIKAVYCPDDSYVVDVLDYDNWDNGVDDNLDRYYKDVEDETKNLKNCY